MNRERTTDDGPQTTDKRQKTADDRPQTTLRMEERFNIGVLEESLFNDWGNMAKKELLFKQKKSKQ
jgi:hypothetical protein